eukprot:5597866-Amphidinium_carterae.1
MSTTCKANLAMTPMHSCADMRQCGAVKRPVPSAECSAESHGDGGDTPGGFGVYQTDHEDANGQFEINWHYDECLRTADRLTAGLLQMGRENSCGEAWLQGKLKRVKHAPYNTPASPERV